MKQEIYRDKLPEGKELMMDATSFMVMRGDWFPALDKGYVRLIDHMGQDVDVSNEATVSFMKESIEFGAKEDRIVKYLGKEHHTSPFRHQFIKLEVYAPLMVARQWWKYVVGSDHTMDAWNEASRRYVTLEPEFYTPEWRWAAGNKKQGSDGAVDDDYIVRQFTRNFEDQVLRGTAFYQAAMQVGIAPEQARCFLPAYALYTPWIWTCSLQSLCHLIAQRTDSHAQWEFQQYANPLEKVARALFPVSAAAMIGNHEVNLRKRLDVFSRAHEVLQKEVDELRERLAKYEPDTQQL